MDAQKKTPLPVAAEQEGQDQNSLSHIDIVPQPSQSVKDRKDRKPWTEEAENRLRSLILSGWNTKQIAKKLGYSESTIQKHIPTVRAKLKEQYGDPPLGNVKQGQDREKDEKKPSPAPLEKIHPSDKVSDPGLLAPGMPMLEVLDNQIDIITDNYCGTIDSLCADSTGLEIRWHDDTQKGQLIIQVEPIKEGSN